MSQQNESLPIVRFGKYKDKPVTDLLADENYCDWLTKQSWFSKKNPVIYNIIVNRAINTDNTPTPIHNQLQNRFLEDENRKKLLIKIYNLEKNYLDLQTKISDDFNIEYNTKFLSSKVQFEGEFNWDIIIYDIYSSFGNVSPLNSFLEINHELVGKINNNRAILSNDWVGEKTYSTFASNLRELRKSRLISAGQTKFDNLHSRKLLPPDCGFRDIDSIVMVIRAAEDVSEKVIEKVKDKYKDAEISLQNDDIKLINKISTAVDNILVDSKLAQDYYYRPTIDTEDYSSKLSLDELPNLSIKLPGVVNYHCIEVKPTLGDDYPCVLRKMSNQARLILASSSESTFFRGNKISTTQKYSYKFILVVGEFNSDVTTTEQLKEIFANSGIIVIFTDELNLI